MLYDFKMQLKLAFSNFVNVNVENILFLKLKLLGLFFLHTSLCVDLGVKTRYFAPTCYLQKNPYKKCNKTTKTPKTLVAKKNRPCEKFYIIDCCEDTRQMSISCLN